MKPSDVARIFKQDPLSPAHLASTTLYSLRSYGTHSCQSVRASVCFHLPFACHATNNIPHSASIIRFPNGIFELRMHLHGVASATEVVPHDNYVLVRGRLAPRARTDYSGNVSALVWSDQPCGVFSRDIPIRLNPGTLVSKFSSFPSLFF